MADTQYALQFASIAREKGPIAERNGRFKQAIGFYKEAADTLREAAATDPMNAPKLLSEARQFDQLISAAQAAAAGGAYPASPAYNSQPAPNPTAPAPHYGAPAPHSANGPAPAQNTQVDAGKPDYSGYALDIVQPKESGIHLVDIIGLEEAKSMIEEALIGPMKHPEDFANYNLEAGGRLLLFGPPGTGKTTFAKAVANECGVPFILKRCTEFVNSHIGESGKAIRAFFQEVRRFAQEQKTPVVLFCDEIDGVALARGSSVTSQETMSDLLQEIEGFNTDSTNIVVIAATNVADQIDSGILSRFKNIEIPLPTQEDRERLFVLEFRQRNVAPERIEELGLDLKTAAALTEKMSGRDIHDIVMSAASKFAIIDGRNRRAPAGTQIDMLEHSRVFLDVVKQKRESMIKTGQL